MAVGEKNREIIEKLYQAFVYGYPLVMLELQKDALTNTELPTNEKAPINQLIHAKGIAGAEDKYIVMLNMDTVYSQVYFDLKKGPLYFRKPKADRYTTALLLDAYGNAVDVIGTGGLGGDGEVNAVLTGPGYRGEIPAGFTRIELPTNLSWALIRIILKDEKDIENVRNIQREFDVRPLAAYGKDYQYEKGRYDPDKDYITFEKINQLSTQEFFDIFNRLIGDNLGIDPDTELLDAVAEYGVGADKTFRLTDFDADVQEELKKFNDRIVAEFDEKSKRSAFGVYKNGWVFPKDTIANFGREYIYRANVAWGGIGANPVSVAIYPTAVMDEEGKPLHSDNDYVFHFESLPPVDGFWSLAAYGTDKFQIPNEIGRYGLNDRSKIDLNEDGSFDIYVQRSRPSDSEFNNWIPSGDKGICLVLRLYLPRKEILDGSWKLPRIIKK